MSRKRTLQQEINEQLEEMDYCIWDEEITFYDNVEVQYIIMEQLKRLYGLSYQCISDLFIRYYGYKFVDIYFWEMQEGGLEDTAYLFLDFIHMLDSNAAYFKHRTKAELAEMEEPYCKEKHSPDVVQALTETVVKLTEHTMYYAGIDKEQAFAELIKTDFFSRFLDGEWWVQIKDDEHLIDDLRKEFDTMT